MNTVSITGKSGHTYTFEGGYNSTNPLQDRSGIYAILDKLNGKYSLVDVGESHQVKTRIENHDRKPCWNGKIKGQIECAVLYTPNANQHGRMQIEQDIRAGFNNLCGDR